MISNSRMQITLLSFLIKNFNIIKKLMVINKDRPKLYAVFLLYATSAFEAIIKQTINQNLKQTYFH
jgi:hypothetical protein